MNHSWRCADEPWVHDSGSTRPWTRAWIRSSPTAAAAFSASAIWASLIGCEVAGLDGVVRPDTGEAVGLQLGPDGLARRRPWPPTLRSRMPSRSWTWWPYSWASDVRLRERPARGAELRLQLVEEAEVDVDVPVGRAVERPDLGARGAAAGVDAAAEEAGLRRLVVCPASAKAPVHYAWMLLT